jgi:serine/threonine protein kinase
VDEEAAARFLREARSAAALDHPNICTVHEVGESEDGLLYLAMSYYRGETLKDYLTSSGALPVDQALDIAGQIARGLACAHAAGIIHRDLKPANVMLTPDGTVKILDFGLAKTRDQTMTASGVLMGTVAYMSPEQLVGAPADARSDLWSLGVMLVEMLTGRHPSIVDDSSTTLARQIGAASKGVIGPLSTTALVRLVERLLRRNPDERYQSAAEVAHDISGLGQRLPTPVDTTEATKVLRALEGRVNKDDHSGDQGDLAENIAVVHMGLGNRAQALTWLERAAAAHSGSMLYLAVDRTYTPLHNEPRFRPS